MVDLPDIVSPIAVEIHNCSSRSPETILRGLHNLDQVIGLTADCLSAAARDGLSDVAPLLAARGIPSLKDAVVDLFLRGETSLDELIPLLNY